MPRYLLDTNIVSFFLRRQFPDLDRHMNSVPKMSIALSVIVEAELRLGLALLPLEAKVHHVADHFLREVEVEPWTSACAKQYAKMGARQQRAGKPLATADAMIAAHALAHDWVLVSNDAVFRQVEGLSVEDWTKGPERT